MNPRKNILLGKCKWKSDLNAADTIATLRSRADFIPGYSARHHALFVKIDELAAAIKIQKDSGGKVTVFEVHGRVGSFDGRIAGFSGLSDDIPMASQCGERHELGGTIMRAHVRMRARLAMR